MYKCERCKAIFEEPETSNFISNDEPSILDIFKAVKNLVSTLAALL